tara:strand:- start:375 stop:536 length:162 start_codon:yes stop_codon:yes gene_type:complete
MDERKEEWWKELISRLEWKLDRCNHLMEFMRTALGLCTLVLQIVILLKLFNII